MERRECVEYGPALGDLQSPWPGCRVLMCVPPSHISKTPFLPSESERSYTCSKLFVLLGVGGQDRLSNVGSLVYQGAMVADGLQAMVFVSLISET